MSYVYVVQMDIPQHLEAAPTRHRDVQHCHVPGFFPNQVEGFLRVPGFAKGGALELVSQNLLQPMAYDGVVVG